jgi:protein-L-isoaspartate(D-aspartate) O-methyltransferase
MRYKLAVRIGKTILIMMLAGCAGLTACKKSPVPSEKPARERIGSQTDADKPGAVQSTGPQQSGSVSPEHLALPHDGDWPRPRSHERLDQRRQMVECIRDVHGLYDPNVLNALLNVPRHWFVPEQQLPLAYADMPLLIGHDQTISQPFIVAYMTSALKLDRDKKVLEIGTGSGYQAAVLNEFTPHVYSIEIVEPLARTAAETLKTHGYATVNLKIGDGYEGWPQHQPFDTIIVTCAPDHIPPALIEQLKPGGKMIIPVGGAFSVQHLVLVSKDQRGEVLSKSLIPVRFVPLIRR